MKNTKRKIFSAVATAALLFNSVGTVFAETTSLVITGNGADSVNTTSVGVSSTTTVVQDNTANITNNVNASSSTGSNSANRNTGGEVSIDTGNSSTGVAVTNAANSNVAEVDGCCTGSASVEISGNGAGTENNAELLLGTSTEVFQANVANIRNNVDANSETGNNDANRNTNGDVSVTTGNADTTVLIDNMANSNLARVGGGDGGSVSLKIMNNGADSVNSIGLGLENSLSLLQDNYANISNDVDADASTGDNEANKNTGGSVMVDTGDASVGVGIDNMANFNVADLDCGCLLDIEAKIAANGAESENEIEALLVDDRLAFQTNVYSCDKDSGPKEFGRFGGHHGQEGCNDVDADASTGDNEVKESTGEGEEGDPAVTTGDADTLVDLSTSANSNVIGDGGEMEWPEVELDFDFGSNWGFLWAWFQGMSN